MDKTMNKEMFKNIRRFMFQQKYFYFNIPFVKIFLIYECPNIKEFTVL